MISYTLSQLRKKHADRNHYLSAKASSENLIKQPAMKEEKKNL